MRYEFDDVGTYKLILEAISNGNTKLNDIKNFMKVKRTDISPYLRNLIEIGFVERRVPVTENIKSRGGRYYVSDNFFKFWFRFIYPNLSSLEEGVFDVGVIKNNYNTYLGGIFEDVAKKFLIDNNFFKFSKIGKWWYNDKEIDVIALNENDNEILFCECKWKDSVDPRVILDKLRENSKEVKWHDNCKESRREYYCIIAKSFRGKIKEENLFLFDLKDLERRLR